MSARGWRSRIGAALRHLRLLGLADRLLRTMHRVAAWAPNGRFAREHPGFALPPARLAYEAYGHVRSDEYFASGRSHARLFVAAIGTCPRSTAPRVLEWGCGSARIIRQLKDAGLDSAATLTGVDVDAEAIAWCRANLAGIDFRPSDPDPPLPFGDGAFDVLYHYSVWTHLSAARVEAWIAEAARVLAPDGMMIGTSHGDAYVEMLLSREARAYCAGLPVERHGADEGRKYFLGFHPPRFLKPILQRHFGEVRHEPAGGAPGVPQDLWIASRPRRP